MKITLDKISKSYDGRPVLTDLNLNLKSGSPSVITGPSGVGKTTLINIILGLTEPDSGRVITDKEGDIRFAPVFQETRLIPSLDAISNVRLACRGKDLSEIKQNLCLIIPAAEINKPVRELSGGTQRRVEIVRAVLAPSDVLIMDEPLSGLDEDTAVRTCDYIKRNIGERIFIAASHSPLFRSFCEEIKL